MGNLKKKIYLTGGYNTISLGTGRKEFHPKKARPGIDEYIRESGSGTLKKIGGGRNVDECVIGNFMASRFNKQAHLGAFFAMIDNDLYGKPAHRVEGACASGSLALLAGIKSLLAETADVVLVIGVEVQNSIKAIYGADVLAGAGWFSERKQGHAYFFPGSFSDRAGEYFQRYGREKTRAAFARWYKNAIENAKLCPTAQEFHNKTEDLEAAALMEPNPAVFVDHLNVYDCSKVSDGASAVAVVSEEGLERIGISKEDAVEIVGFGHSVGDITKKPADPCILDTTENALKNAFKVAEISKEDLCTAEIHDCFTIAAVLGVEALGFAGRGEGPEFISAGETSREGSIPLNTTGGLIGWGHPTGCTGVHQSVTILEQLSGKAEKNQILVPEAKPYGLSVNMGGDDKTVVSIVYKKTQ